MSKLAPRDYFNQQGVQQKFAELLGKRANQFITTVLQIANGNEQLKSADPTTLYSAAVTAAALDLPVNPNLGFAYIVPYKGAAAFQMGYKGFIQLAQRSGQFKTINVSDVKETEIANFDRLSGEISYEWIKDDAERAKKQTIGYVAYFELLNGFRKSLYMSKAELEQHGKNFSQTYKKGFGLWKDNFDAMAKKTVLKLLLSRYAPLTIDMQTAQIADQSVIRDADTMDVDYVDNTEATSRADIDAERDRVATMLKNCADVEEVEALVDGNEEVAAQYADLFTQRKNELNEKRK